MNQNQDPNQFTAPPTNGGFSNELKGGEFTGNYNTGTSPVSQVFRDGNMLGDNRAKVLIGFGVVALVVFAAIFFMSGGEESKDDFLAGGEDIADVGDDLGEDNEMGDTATEEGTLDDDGDEFAEDGETITDKTDTKAKTPAAAASGVAEDADAQAPIVAEEVPVNEAVHENYDALPVVAPTALSPEEGAKRVYDETSYPSEFRWEGSGGWISFSQSPDMNPVSHKFRSKQNVFRYRKFIPGVWYWRVTNASGSTQIRSFEILPSPLRNIALASPQAGGTLAGNGGVVSWTGDEKVAYYRVEISNSGWAAPTFKFATSATQKSISDVPPGSYELRVGAFSEVSGRWEYTDPVAVTVQ